MKTLVKILCLCLFSILFGQEESRFVGVWEEISETLNVDYNTLILLPDKSGVMLWRGEINPEVSYTIRWEIIEDLFIIKFDEIDRKVNSLLKPRIRKYEFSGNHLILYGYPQSKWNYSHKYIRRK